MADFKTFRKLNKLTQQQTAEYFGCLQSFISQIETGRCAVPDSFISKILADGIYQLPTNMSKNADGVSEGVKSAQVNKEEKPSSEELSSLKHTIQTQSVAINALNKAIELQELELKRRDIDLQDKEQEIFKLKAEIQRLQRANEGLEAL